MKNGVAAKPITPILKNAVGVRQYEPPVFETVESFEVVSRLHNDNTKVRVLLRRQLNHRPSRYAPGPFWLDLTVGGYHSPHYCVTEESAREAACRFLLKHVQGTVPVLN